MTELISVDGGGFSGTVDFGATTLMALGSLGSFSFSGSNPFMGSLLFNVPPGFPGEGAIASFDFSATLDLPFNETSGSGTFELTDIMLGGASITQSFPDNGAFTGSMTLNAVQSPASLLLVLAGIGGLCVVGRRRRALVA